ncbi:hypothetical protein OZX72_07305 [Bifidobacterium sp. ESL0769]|uniref:hypothetical protein n=1 Tax=Bifidobacterium sp. ESL0769 TaxID=2983229 RepID=UPI0023F6B61A|nr:hypothetical protein [Bifidobacterium sp. ESL0769]WEV67044.1 hypothetical protein OZX72_07305 [Bifidobacterium sp. ESL0769]
MEQLNKSEVKIKYSGWNGVEPTRFCVNCDLEKPLSEFGYRNVNKKKEGADRDPKVIMQSWCDECRPKKEGETSNEYRRVSTKNTKLVRITISSYDTIPFKTCSSCHNEYPLAKFSWVRDNAGHVSLSETCVSCSK